VSLGVVTTCGFVEGNGNLVAVLEDTLPPISDGFYQLRANPKFFEIVAAGQKVGKFDMPSDTLFELLTHLSQIAVVECEGGSWPDVITNAMYVQTSREVLI
jgi:hypothetical protein